MKFTQYAANKNCKILKDDLAFLHRQIGHLPDKKRFRILRQYIDVWVTSMGNCDNVIKKQNYGRFMANSWIRNGALNSLLKED